jgi:crotonobetainyl-CoA:carnitine CoA-transferase CaiB-like acyl-CoA transferase
MNKLPLQGLIVLEFSQYLSGPAAGLRLADLGARVIKIERPKGGDACRNLAIENLWADDNSLLFHTINRNKESFAADLKNPDDLLLIKRLIEEADVVTHNFRPGVMEKVGLDYASVQQINPRIIYAEITGYGKKGPWKHNPGQDLLLQSLAGLTFTTANKNDNPTPFGLSIGDTICGSQMVQGILAALIRRQKTGKGALIELSLLESLLDFQFELLTTYYASGKLPERSRISNGNPLLGAPYGIYATTDGHIAIAMVDIQRLAVIIECAELGKFTQEQTFELRDEIKEVLTAHLLQKPSDYWLQKLKAEDIWSMKVLNWQQLIKEDAYKCLQMEQTVKASNGNQITTTRCPIRINGERLFSETPAPVLGEHNESICREMHLVSIPDVQ